MKELSADSAYLSLENVDAVVGAGAEPFIAFKENPTGGAGGTFAKTFHYFKYRQNEFLNHYHKRSNVESTFSMIKSKFGDALRSKSDVAMVNEVLCKVLCHNLACLIQSMYELGISPVFWEQDEAEPPAVASLPEPAALEPEMEWAWV